MPDAVEQVRAAVVTPRHRLMVRLAPESALVWADRKRMVQVLVNLLHNAVKYTPEEGGIVVSIDVQPERVLFAVQDNGIGMSAGFDHHFVRPVYSAGILSLAENH